MNVSFLTVTALALSAAAAAQPTPNPQPRNQPRAEWLQTNGVTGTAPANRHWSQATGDGTSLYVFGGRTGTSGSGSKRNDLWEFDASTKGWTQHTVDGDPSAPLQRYRNGLAYDPTNNRLVMFGGEDSSGGILGDTWEYDLNNNVWNNITPQTSPPARRFTALAYDPSTSLIVLFGGLDSNGAPLSDTWLLAGGTWIQASPAASPPARAHHSLVTRENFGDVFLCAGHDNAGAPNRVHFLDTWSWNGAASTWSQILPTTTAVPHGVAGNQAVYDPLRLRVIIHGGQGISTNANGTGGAYGSAYGGSPSGWTSEFDCLTNEWLLYGDPSFNTGDPVVGRSSRYYTAFLEGKVYKWGGQNPSGTGISLTSVKEYQAIPIASTSPIGTGCSGIGGGTVTLTGDREPWLGRTFVANVTGLAPGSLAFVVFGFATASTPLSSLHPAGRPGCTLYASLDITLPVVNSGGNASLPFPLPNDPTFAGASLHQQFLQLEIQNGQIAAFSSSNGLTLIPGAL